MTYLRFQLTSQETLNNKQVIRKYTVYLFLWLTTAVLWCKKMFLYVLILQKLFNSVRLLYKYRPTTKSGRSNFNAKKSMIQIILYSQLIYFTYIYLSEARTSAKCRNNVRELLTNTEETFYFTQRTTGRGSKHMYMVYNHYIFSFQ